MAPRHGPWATAPGPRPLDHGPWDVQSTRTRLTLSRLEGDSAVGAGMGEGDAQGPMKTRCDDTPSGESGTGTPEEAHRRQLGAGPDSLRGWSYAALQSRDK